MKYLVLGLAILLLASCGGRPQSFYHQNASFEQYRADSRNCAAQVRGERGSLATTGTTNSRSAAANAISSFGAGFAAGLADARARYRAYVGCMHGRGYRLREMTPEETQRLYNATTDEQEEAAWRSAYENETVAEKADRETPIYRTPEHEAAACEDDTETDEAGNVAEGDSDRAPESSGGAVGIGANRC